MQKVSLNIDSAKAEVLNKKKIVKAKKLKSNINSLPIVNDPG